jgi:hypothetical protein
MEVMSVLEPIYTVLYPERMLFDIQNGTWFVEAIHTEQSELSLQAHQWPDPE